MNLVYEGNWSTYEEWGSIRIFENEDGQLFCQEGGYSVMAPYDENGWNEVYEISYDGAIELIDEWDKIEKEYENYFS
jgi:gamma-glutamylcyclotransferase (GGCT)/AIG2-like uncharacterized protein YtfP